MVFYRFLPDFQRRNNANSTQNYSQNTDRIFPNSFYEATVTLTPKAHRDSTKKENYSPIFLININAKNTCNKILTNQIHIKGIHHALCSSMPYTKDAEMGQHTTIRNASYHINKLNE